MPHHYNSLSNKMGNSLLAVRYINHKYIVVERRKVFINKTKKRNQGGMIKRPLLFLTAAYLAGICAGSSRGIPGLLFAAVLCFILSFIFHWKIYYRDKLLFFVPLFIAAGLWRVSLAETEKPLATGECSAHGIVKQSFMGTGTGKMFVEIENISFQDKKTQEFDGTILVYAENWKLAAPKSKIKITGELKPFSTADNPGQFDEYEYYKAQGIHAKLYADEIKIISQGRGISRILWRMKQKLSETFHAVLPESYAGILDAMLLAEKGMLPQETKELYRDAGLSHALVVSGLHLSLLGFGLYQLLCKLKIGANSSVIAAAVIVLGYGCFAGFGIPVLRASVMLLLSLFAKCAGKTYDAPTGLSLSALIILWKSPLQLFQAGFLLSFGAVAGILLFQPLFEKMGVRLIGSSLSVQLVLVPITLWFFYEFPIYSIFLNLIVLPFISLLLVLGILTGIAGAVSLFFGRFFAGGVYALLAGYEMVCRVNKSLPNNLLCTGRPQPWQVIFYYIVLFVFWIICKRDGRKRYLVFLAALGVFLFPKRSGWQTAFLSVGQGDCAVIQSEGLTILMDAGSSIKGAADRILIPYLKYTGDTTINYAVISHTDSDHCSMLADIFRSMAEKTSSITVEALVLPEAGISGRSAENLRELAKAAGVKVVAFRAGDCLRTESFRLECLYPPASLGAGIPDTNDTSLVFLAAFDNADFLFTGDTPEAGETAVIKILEEKGKWRGKGKLYLKSAHHGSRYSNSDAFLELAKNSQAVISCGEGNSYGHPHKETLERMEKNGITKYITWQTGAVIVTDKEKVICWKLKNRNR